MYRCPGCSREVEALERRCPGCGLDLNSLARLHELSSYHYNEALRLAAEGSEERAQEHLLAALTLDPNDAAAHFFLGRLYARAGKYKLAAEHWKKTLQLEPGHEKARAYLAKVESFLERKEGWRSALLPRVCTVLALLVCFILAVTLAWLGGKQPGPEAAVADVARALQNSPALTGLNLDVRAAPDQALILEGRVPSLLHRQLAGTIAAGAAEKWKVVNNLKVADLKEKVEDALRKAGLVGAELEVKQEGPYIFLHGRVLTLSQLRLAEQAAKAVEGVEGVDVRGIILLAEPVVYRYSFREGDTLWDLAARIYGDPLKWRDIARANRISEPGAIPAGRVLEIPVAPAGS